MGRSQADVAATALVAVLACVAAAAGAPAATMTVLGIALFAAPGYLLGQLLVGSRTAGLERVAVMTALALAVPVLGGLLLNVAEIPLHRPGWLGLLAGVTLAADTALFARRRAAGTGRATRPAMEVPPATEILPVTQARPAAHVLPAAQVQTRPAGRAAPHGPGPGWRTSRWHIAVFAAAVLVAATAVSLAAFGAARQPQPGFTQLWLAPQRQGVHTLSLGVTNDQGRTTSYRLVLRRGGRVIGTWNLTLGEGRTWQRPVPDTGQQVLAAGLYRLPDLAHPYRYVSVGPGSGAAGL
jgi:hypothetical protein